MNEREQRRKPSPLKRDRWTCSLEILCSCVPGLSCFLSLSPFSPARRTHPDLFQRAIIACGPPLRHPLRHHLRHPLRILAQPFFCLDGDTKTSPCCCWCIALVSLRRLRGHVFFATVFCCWRYHACWRTRRALLQHRRRLQRGPGIATPCLLLWEKRAVVSPIFTFLRDFWRFFENGWDFFGN